MKNTIKISLRNGVPKHLLGQPQVSGTNITMKFWFLSKNKRYNLVNYAKLVVDLLVKEGCLVDGAFFETGPLHLIPMGVDKENPRCIISCPT